MSRPRRSSLVWSVSLLLACAADGGSGDDTTTDGGSSSSSTGPTTSATMSTSTTTSTTASTSTTTTTDPGSSTSEPMDSSGGTAADSTGSGACVGLSFFATSVGSGDAGGDLGGLEGADATCQQLAEAAGEVGCTWHAYLSTSAADARDRIGDGPWFNAAGEMIAADVEALHTDGLSNGDPQHILDEYGAEIPGNEHDILTGSQADGTALADASCNDWTDGTDAFVARVGHSDIPGNPMFSPSWNSAHDTPGCSAQGLDQTGGAGRLYCFAID